MSKNLRYRRVAENAEEDMFTENRGDTDSP